MSAWLAPLLVPYLVAWLWVWGIALGALPLLMLHELTGGAWGDALRPSLRAAAATLPIVALAFVPVLLGLHLLYPWTHDGSQAGWYLDPTFFVARALVYFAVWLALARRFVAEPARRSPRASAIGLIVYALTVSFAAVDWIMSLTPEWHSTVFGLLIAVGQLSSALAFAVAMQVVGGSIVARPPPGDEALAPADLRNDFGNLLLTFTMLWAYLAFTQYLVIWIGNLPHDIGWYVVRGDTSWRWLGIVVIACHFAVPFGALLFRPVKRRAASLLAVAAGLLLASLLDGYWTVAPTFRADGFHVGLVDLPVIAVVVGGWLSIFRRRHARAAAGAPTHVLA